jgi:hypothetical protein
MALALFKFAKKVFVALLATSTMSCQVAQSSKGKEFAAVKSAKNIALILGAPSAGENRLEGVATDVQAMQTLLSNPDLGFTVKVVMNATASDMISAASAAAQQVSNDGTVLIYYSGHGIKDGRLFSQDEQAVRFSSIVDAMAKQRSAPFRRLVVAMDSCFSGQNVNGPGAILTGSGSSGTSGFGLSLGGPNLPHAQIVTERQQLSMFVDAVANGSKPFKVRGRSGTNSALALDGAANPAFEQALFIAASQKSQTSQDAGSQYGGVFTFSWRTVLKTMFNDPTKTMRDMLNATVKQTYAFSGGGHTPVFRAVPESILDEKLLSKDQPNQIPNTIPDSSVSPDSSVPAQLYVGLTPGLVDAPTLYVSFDQGAAASGVYLFAGSKSEIAQNQSQNPVLTLSKATQLVAPGLQFYSSSSAWNVSPGVYTVVVKAADGRIILQQSFKIDSKC